MSCVLEDSALLTGVDNITVEAAEQQASNRVHRRGLIRRNKEFYAVQATPTTRRIPFQVQVNK
jgi:hypothetical protein